MFIIIFFNRLAVVHNVTVCLMGCRHGKTFCRFSTYSFLHPQKQHWKRWQIVNEKHQKWLNTICVCCVILQSWKIFLETHHRVTNKTMKVRGRTEVVQQKQKHVRIITTRIFVSRKDIIEPSAQQQTKKKIWGMIAIRAVISLRCWGIWVNGKVINRLRSELRWGFSGYATHLRKFMITS